MDKLFITIFFCTVIAGAPAWAQPAPETTDSTDVIHKSPAEEKTSSPVYHHTGRSPHELSIWGVYSNDSMRFWGKTPDATLNQFGFSYNRTFLSHKNLTLKYQVALNLYSRYTYPEYKPGGKVVSLSGLGFSPAGLKLNFRTARRVQPYVSTSGGFLLLENPFPDERGTRFNFTLGAGIGIEFQLSHNLSFSTGYKYFHLSNGESGQVNPGVDSNSLYFAFTLF